MCTRFDYFDSGTEESRLIALNAMNHNLATRVPEMMHDELCTHLLSVCARRTWRVYLV